MRLLFVALDFPLPATNGHRMRTWNLLQVLAAEGHELTLLAFAPLEAVNGHYGALQEVCREIEVVPLALTNLSTAGDYLGRLVGLGSGLPYAVRRFRSSRMQARIRERLAQAPFDAVICDTVFSAVNLPTTPVPILLNNVDVEHVILERYLAFERNPLKRLYAQMEARKVRNWERGACQRAALGMACSEPDRRALHQLCPDLPVVVVPNVVDTESYRPAGEGIPLTVLYQGGMDWFPNRDAVEFFVGATLPELRKLARGVKFVVAGRSPSESFRRRFARHRDVVFTGTVADMRAEIAKAAVCVVPLRIGSGTRLKILEAAAMAKPIVSTPLGVEGLDFREGEEIVLADDPRAFARAVAGLLADQARREALGQAARRWVEQSYSLRTLQEALDRALVNCVETSTLVAKEHERISEEGNCARSVQEEKRMSFDKADASAEHISLPRTIRPSKQSGYELTSYWDAVASRVELRGPQNVLAGDDTPLTRYVRDTFLEEFRRMNFQSKSVVEVGCGPGGNLVLLARSSLRRLVGCDISQKMLELAKKNLDAEGLAAELVCSNENNLPFSDKEFDVSFTVTVLQHIPDDQTFLNMLREICRVTQKEVCLFEDTCWKRWEKCSHLARPVQEYQKYMKNHGFKLVKVKPLSTVFTHGACSLIRRLTSPKTWKEGEPLPRITDWLQRACIPSTRPFDRVLRMKLGLTKMVFRPGV